MTPSDFNLLPVIEQAILVSTDAELIGEYHDNEYSYSAYTLLQFYVEVSIEMANHKNIAYKATSYAPSWMVVA